MELDMPIFDAENPVFINLAGAVDELGRVQLIPLPQSSDRPKVPGQLAKSDFSVRLHYQGDGLLERSVYSSAVSGCGTKTRVGLDQTVFWISIPHVQGADLLQLTRDNEVILEQRLNALPTVTDVLVKTSGAKLNISWRSKAKGIIAYFVVLKLANGKSIPLGRTDKVKKLAYILEGLPKGGQARVEVTASDGVLSTSSVSKVFDIEPSAPLGAIISPANGARFELSTPVSLLASCGDAFGEQIKWDSKDLSWQVDGTNYSNNSRMELLADLKPGEHTVELTSKEWGVLSRVTIRVNDYSDEAKRYDKLFEKLKIQRTLLAATES